MMKYNLLLLLAATFIISAQEQEVQYEWSALFTEFLPIKKQDLSPTPIFDTNSKANIKQQITVAQQEAYDAEKKYEILQQVADKAKLIAEQKSAALDALKKASL